MTKILKIKNRDGYMSYRVTIPVEVIRKINWEKQEQIVIDTVEINGEKALVITTKKPLQIKQIGEENE